MDEKFYYININSIYNVNFAVSGHSITLDTYSMIYYATNKKY